MARRFLRCGDLHFGFARIQCPDCHHEMFVAFSCQQRCLCSSCHQKRTILVAETIAHTICAPVPHRQLVFTIPKRLRIYCRNDRRLLGGLTRAAWQATVKVYRQQLKRGDLIPGMVAGIQTFGELVHFHPHIHAIVSGGGFTPGGTFICLPRINTRRLLAEWQNNVFALFLAENKMDQETVDLMRSWRHSGFSVDNIVLDFLAEVTQHIPNKGQHLVRYYGWYAHRQRGMRAKAGSDSKKIIVDRTAVDAQRNSRRSPCAGSVSTWPRLIKRVYDVDPLECPECGGAMKTISLIERRQRDVIQRVLRHCGLWQGFIRIHASPRAPPAAQQPLPTAPCEFVLVPDGELLEAQLGETLAEASREFQLVLDPEFL